MGKYSKKNVVNPWNLLEISEAWFGVLNQRDSLRNARPPPPPPCCCFGVSCTGRSARSQYSRVWRWMDMRAHRGQFACTSASSCSCVRGGGTNVNWIDHLLQLARPSHSTKRRDVELQTEAVVTVPDVRGVAICCKRGRQPPSFVEVFKSCAAILLRVSSAPFLLICGDYSYLTM